jgi:hypothetical protein
MLLALCQNGLAQGYIAALNATNTNGAVYEQPIVGYANDGTFGWAFSTSQDIIISSLGWLAAGTNSSAANVFVGLWSIDGALISSTAIDSNSVLVNGSFYESINPVFVAAGSTLVVGIGSSGAVSPIIGLLSAATESPINFAGAGSSQGNGFTFPTIQSGTVGVAMGATFLFQPVPEPSALGLSALGGLFLTWHRWKARAI